MTSKLRNLIGRRALPWLLAFLFVSAVYLYAFPQANVFYAGVVLCHVLVGVVASIYLFVLLLRLFRESSLLARFGWILIAASALLGLALIKLGTSRDEWNWLYLHIGLATVGSIILFADWAGRRGWLAAGMGRAALRYAICLIALAGLATGAWYSRNVRWQNSVRIQNPTDAPETMNQEGDGPQGDFFPSSAQVYGHQKIPSKFFMESDSCQRCHADIYKQWQSSAHHFSSFNNQWYRKSIEYMQDRIGTKPSKWCGGCHDPAVLYAGMMDTPIKQIVHRPEAQAGLGCMMCHSIANVKSTMGQADFYLEYPKLHELAATKNSVARAFHDFLIKLNPEPHRRVFLKPFMRDQTPEFCSSCHKVHLDIPVNSYRWLRGFNEYDNWQASGVSGEGARSFYYPKKPSKCADCHMPLVDSQDPAAKNGKVRSHRFAAANTALPFVNGDAAQLKAVQDFLRDGQVSVDIFGIVRSSPSETAAAGRSQSSTEPRTASTFAVGEESINFGAAQNFLAPAADVIAPLGNVGAAVRRGDSVRVEVVVRTRKVGHFFPGGTVDAFDVWVELEAVDEHGRTLLHSGEAADGGRGPVDPGAHFYRSLQLDEHGNPINKRNAWSARSVAYVRLIPPGAADTIHYRLQMPEDAGDRIYLKAKVNYRKFAWWNTQWAYAGVRDPADKNPSITAAHDDGKWVFTGDTSQVSGPTKAIPDIPTTVMAHNETVLRVLPRGASLPNVAAVMDPTVRERWNDYGIGLLLQGDIKNAEATFLKVTRMEPSYADGWVNVGRARVQEGNMAGAEEVLRQALHIDPELAKTHFFLATALKSLGRYDEAIDHLKSANAKYPRDRVVLNQLGRVLFLKRQYKDAIGACTGVLGIDPEDLQAHYNLMLCYQGLGDAASAARERTLYERFKADESSQSITGPYRQLHAEDNNERQQIHEHTTAAVQPVAKSATATAGSH